MPNITFTDLAIKALKPSEKQVKYFDTKLPAFGVRIGKHRKTFIVMNGRDRKLHSLGQYPEVSLLEARKKAMMLLAGAATVVVPVGVTFPRVRAAFLEARERALRPKSYAQIKRSLIKYCKWEKLLSEVTYYDILEVLDGIEAPSERAHTFKDIRTFFNWCIPRYIKSSPCLGMKMPKQKARERVLTDDELSKVWHKAKAIGYQYGTIVQLLILTGLRVGEIAGLEWDWIDGQWLTIPARIAKNGRASTIPLSKIASDIIAEVPRIAPLLFPARGYQNKGFGGFGKMKIELDKCGVTGFTHHDLRRTFATNMARLGVRLE